MGHTGRVTIPAIKWEAFDDLRARGHGIKDAAFQLGIDPNTAYIRNSRRSKKDKEVHAARIRKQDRDFRGRQVQIDLGEEIMPIDYADLTEPARRAWDDFSYFQQRYLGRIATPWQAEAAGQVGEWLKTPEKEYVVENAPPGCGKSTTFTCDIALWLTVRNRGIRGQLASKVQKSAEKYVTLLRTLLTLTEPYMPEADLLSRGLAIEAEATLAQDFGTFRPEETQSQWNAQGFVVAQMKGRAATRKEPTWSAFGMDSAFLGMRYDIILWDDLVDEKTIKTVDAIDNIRSWWDKVAEKRLDPGGVLILQGQRMGAEDLYRYCLDKKNLPDDMDDDDNPDAAEFLDKKYRHVVYKAHYVDRCVGEHSKTAPYYPEGCLLDPRRLTWRELQAEMANNKSNFEVLYQQEDVDPENVLINPMWIAGGTDINTGEQYPGCLDPLRAPCQLPKNLQGQILSVVTADPSPTQYWSVQWWAVRCVDGQPQERYLLDHIRRKMDAPDFLDWNNPTQSFVGIMDQWQARSHDLHIPITTWIVEKNGAQRFLLQYEHVKRWQAQWRVAILPHETERNKSDPEFGIQTLKGIYHYGLVRLPYNYGMSTPGVGELIRELTHYPGWRTDDTVMANWFLEWNLPRLIPSGKALPRMNRPSWLKSTNTWQWRKEMAGHG